MTKLIGLKELQQNTKWVREEVAKGIHFLVIYRAQPIFEIKPVGADTDFVDDLEATGLYTETFVRRMKKAEKDVKKGKVKTYTAEAFLNSL